MVGNRDQKAALAGLIGAGDPAPFECLGEDGRAPMLIICDHASNAMPAAVNGLGLSAEMRNRHIACDLGAAEITRALAAELDATAVLAGYSRLLADCNRAPDDADAIPETSDDIPIPGNRGLGLAEKAARGAYFFRPYHDAVCANLDRLCQGGAAPAMLSVHTFTPRMNGEDRPWDIGVLWNRDRRMADAMIRGLESGAAGLCVGDNRPYSGQDIAYSLNHHAGARGLPHCAVEIRQDLATGAGDARRWAAVIAGIMREILARPNFLRVQHF